jgi:hypothetical protein
MYYCELKNLGSMIFLMNLPLKLKSFKMQIGRKLALLLALKSATKISVSVKAGNRINL